MALKIQKTSTPSRLFVGMFGTPGSGKSFGAAALGARWVKRKGGNASVWVFDTENSWGWLVPKLAKVGVELVRADASKQEDRKVSDLREFLREGMKAEAGVLCIDSLTHIVEQCDSDYVENNLKRRKNPRSYMEAQDYPAARKDFKALCSQMLSAAGMDLIVCGRHGLEYGVVEGKNQPIGHKMKAADFGYEPDLLIEAKRYEYKASKRDTDSVTRHEYSVEKDRSGLLRAAGPIITEAGADEMAAFAKVAKSFDPLFDFLLGGATETTAMEPEQAPEGGEG